MSTIKKEKWIRISFAVNGLVLILTAIDILSSGYWIWGAVSFLGAAINFAGLKEKISAKAYFNVTTSLINSFLGLFNMIYFIQRGSQYIQWLWMLVSVFYFLLSIVFLVRQIKKTKYQSTSHE